MQLANQDKQFEFNEKHPQSTHENQEDADMQGQSTTQFTATDDQMEIDS
jgi:hypothetical protein